MAKKTIQELAADLYDDAAIAEAVCQDAERLHNVEKIQAGELVLPSPGDAANWYKAKVQAERQAEVEEAKDTLIELLRNEIATLRKSAKAGA